MKVNELSAQLIEPVTIYPQLMKNVPVRDKKEAQEDPDVRAVIAEVETDLGENGRVLVRESGTEPVVRVMVEQILMKNVLLM